MRVDADALLKNLLLLLDYPAHTEVRYTIVKTYIQWASERDYDAYWLQKAQYFLENGKVED